MIIKELLFNTMKYGKSPMFEILLYDKVITVIDDGGKFNLLEFKDAPSSGYGGGKKTVDLYLNTHKNIEINYRWRNDKGENIYSFRKIEKIEDGIIKFSRNCEITLGNGIEKYKESIIPKRCNELIIRIERHSLSMSRGLRINAFVEKLLEDDRCSNYNIIILVPKNTGMLHDFSTHLSNTHECISIMYSKK